MHQNLDALNKTLPDLICDVEFLDSTCVWTCESEIKFLDADVVLFFWMGAGLDHSFLRKASEFMQKKKICHLFLIENSGEDKLSYGFLPEEIKKIREYFRYDGKENLLECVFWLAQNFCQADCIAKKPKLLAWYGIYHPDWKGHCQDTDGYYRSFYKEDRLTIGLLFYRTEWITGKLFYLTAMIRELEKQGMNVIAVFSNTMTDYEIGSPSLIEALHNLFYRDNKILVDTLINCTKFSLTVAGTTVDMLQTLNIPILQAYTVLTDYASWEKSIEGLDPMEVSISISLPEFDGIIHGVPIATKVEDMIGGLNYEPIPERISRMATKAKKWASLRHKPNSEKKIAIIFHNYPSINSNIGSAAGLDSPESVCCLLQKMQKLGYQVDHIPVNSREFMNELTKNATNDRHYITEKQIKEAVGHLSKNAYQKFFNHQSDKVRKQMEKDWGEAPGDIFRYDESLLIPGVLNGNLFITVQPPRGFGEDPGKLLHSPDCAPTHHYIGYYHWLRDIWKADAVIHVGTHGSLEWLPGKGTGLSEDCYPDISIGDLPNVYPYWMTIVGEGIQAKRRGAACLISHLSPPMQLSGAYDEIQELEKALEEYSHFKIMQPENIEPVKAIIREKAVAVNLTKDVPEGADFEDYVRNLHNYVTDIKNMQIRTGLHVMGKMPKGEEFIEYIKVLVRLDNGSIPSIIKLFAKEHGCSFEVLLNESGKMMPDGKTTYGAFLDVLEEDCRQFIIALSEQDFMMNEVVMQLPIVNDFSAAGKEKLQQIMKYICDVIVPNLRKTKQEITNTMRALDGDYIEPSPAGAPSSGGADLLPTGRNFFGVDPRQLPTVAAWEIGKKLGDEVIAQYIIEEGRYPEAVGIIFWAGSNMRSHGQCIAEFLYLMGIRPVWQRPSMKVQGIELIPLEELKRPRIDVTGRISGLFRDSMPDAVLWLDKAVKLAAGLDETVAENYIRKHVIKDVSNLVANGASPSAAWEEASYRIFGDPPGAYGAGIGDLLESKQWNTIEDLASVYTRFSGHAYGVNAKGVYQPKFFQKRMGELDVTIKNEDNRETHMFSSDDFNAYHGGMIATVRAISGKNPQSYSGDSTDRQQVKVRTIQEEVKRLFRGEAMNPKFIEGMKKHGYKGAQDLANYLAHSYQWDATSNVMEDWMYEKYAEKYVLDKKMQKWMKDVNPWALQRMTEVLLEANQRGLWRSKTETKGELEKLFLSMEGEMEEHADDRKS